MTIRRGRARLVPRSSCVLVLLLLVGCAEATSEPSAANGTLDLRSWNFEANGLVQLKGSWEFCWGELFSPDDPGPDPGGCSYLDVPGLWTDDGAAPGTGFATYRLRILLPPDRPSALALRAGAPMTAHRLWIDGEAQSGTGTVARVADDYASQLHNRVHFLPSVGDELQLLVQVANFDFRSGGIRRRWILGTPDAVGAWADSVTVRDTALATVYVLVGLIFLGFFAIRPQERTRLYFGLAGVALGLRMVPATYSDIAQLVAPDLMFPTTLRLEYFANNFVVFAGMGYFAHKVANTIPTRVAGAIQLASFAGMLGALFLPLSLSQIPMRSAWILGAAMLAMSLYGLAVAARRGEPNVRVTLAAVPVCLALVLWDSLRAEGAMVSPAELVPGSTLLMVMTEVAAFFPMTMLMMILIESMVLLRTFSRSYDTIADLSQNLAASNVELRETNRAVVRFVPFDFLRLLNRESIRDVERGDCLETEMSIMFCDIRSFTAVVERMTPDEAFRYVNAFTEGMEPAIHAHGGFINSYLGDCIMALFPTKGDEAVRAGIEMQAALEGFNRSERERGESHDPTRIGIGVNTGTLVIGTIGGLERLDNNVIGDAVNIASRVESLSQLYGASFLISGTTFEGLADASAYQLRELDRVVVKGRSQSIPIYEVLDGLDPEERLAKLAIRERFDRARLAYVDQSFAAAEQLFAACLAECPDDLVSALYIERCRRLAVDGVPPGWQGETVIAEK